jgi:hypothetical protein
MFTWRNTMQQNEHRDTREAYTIYFPETTFLGRVFVVPSGDDPVQQYLWFPEFPAQGPVIVPANHRAVLVYEGDTIAPLTTLRPDDIDELHLYKWHQNVSPAGYRGRLDDTELSYLAHLSGVRRLYLSRIEVAPQAFSQLQTLTHITDMLLVGGEYDDTLFPVLEKMTHLEALAVNDTAMTFTDEDVARLQHLPHLQRLCGFGIADDLMPVLSQFPALRSLDLSDCGVTNKGLRSCRDMPYLEELNLGMSYNIGNNGMRHLCVIASLRNLNLFDLAGVTNAGLAALQELPNLQQLYLGGTRITDRGIGHLRGMSRLDVLELPDTITDSGLRVLSALPSLRVLSIRLNSALTNTGLAVIGKCPVLQVLDLSETAIGDDGLLLLRDIPHLTVLDLWGTPVSDVGLVHLHHHRRLQHLIVKDTRVTDKGIAALQEALPQCYIVS